MVNAKEFWMKEGEKKGEKKGGEERREERREERDKNWQRRGDSVGNHCNGYRFAEKGFFPRRSDRAVAGTVPTVSSRSHETGEEGDGVTYA